MYGKCIRYYSCTSRLYCLGYYKRKKKERCLYIACAFADASLSGWFSLPPRGRWHRQRIILTRRLRTHTGKRDCPEPWLCFTNGNIFAGADKAMDFSQFRRGQRGSAPLQLSDVIGHTYRLSHQRECYIGTFSRENRKYLMTVLRSERDRCGVNFGKRGYLRLSFSCVPSRCTRGACSSMLVFI